MGFIVSCVPDTLGKCRQKPISDETSDSNQPTMRTTTDLVTGSIAQLHWIKIPNQQTYWPSLLTPLTHGTWKKTNKNNIYIYMYMICVCIQQSRAKYNFAPAFEKTIWKRWGFRMAFSLISCWLGIQVLESILRHLRHEAEPLSFHMCTLLTLMLVLLMEEIPNNHLGCIKTRKIFWETIYQLVQDFHQQ